MKYGRAKGFFSRGEAATNCMCTKSRYTKEEERARKGPFAALERVRSSMVITRVIEVMRMREQCQTASRPDNFTARILLSR